LVIINGAGAEGEQRAVRAQQDRHFEAGVRPVFREAVRDGGLRLYHNFISPYEEDQQRPHPLITEIPEGFTTFDFQFDKINNRLVEDSFIYIFYNVIDERLQLQAGRNL
jgi:hypothetical protein